MAANALEEKINKIKLQNEEIKRRYEEVEADKKNAAKLNALVQMVPSSDWPERKEPPEFTTPNRNSHQSKAKPLMKDHYHNSGNEGKVVHKFAEGDGPPPDPKYNFLADSERDICNKESVKDEDKKKDRNRFARGGLKKRGSGKDLYSKEHHTHQTISKKESLPEYEAWRAERNRIDEARINRQRTAEGNWRREWDNDKVAMDHEASRKDLRFKSNENMKRETKDYDKRHHFDGEHSSHTRMNDSRIVHSPYKSTYTHQQDVHRTNSFQQHQTYSKSHHDHFQVTNEERTVTATNKSLKITVNHGSNVPKAPVMSVKVNSVSIAGTGRVGPRQKARIAYSSHSETETTMHELDNSRSKQFDDRANGYKLLQSKSPYVQRKKDSIPKSPHQLRNDPWKNEKLQHKRDYKEVSKALPSQKQYDNFSNVPKSPGVQRRKEEPQKDQTKRSAFQEVAKDKSAEGSNEECDVPQSEKDSSGENTLGNTSVTNDRSEIDQIDSKNEDTNDTTNDTTNVAEYTNLNRTMEGIVDTDISVNEENIQKNDDILIKDNNKSDTENNKLNNSAESNDSGFNDSLVTKNDDQILRSVDETEIIFENITKNTHNVENNEYDKKEVCNENLESEIKNTSTHETSSREIEQMVEPLKCTENNTNEIM